MHMCEREGAERERENREWDERNCIRQVLVKIFVLLCK